MGRVAPFIFVALAVVAGATYQARTVQQTATTPLIPSDPVVTTELPTP
ncbi:hypothetical protein [Shimia sp.]